MKKLLILLLSLLVLSIASTGCSDSPRSDRHSASQWYEGGTLHSATLDEWSRASRSNRLATAADFATHSLAKGGKGPVDMAIVKRWAKRLEAEISDVALEPGLENQRVSEVAAMSFILLESQGF
jgi:hypothetical protein